MSRYNNSQCFLYFISICSFVIVCAATEEDVVEYEPSDIVSLAFYPEKLEPIFVGDYSEIQILLNETIEQDQVLHFQAEITDDWLTRATIVNESSFNFTQEYDTVNISIKGEFLGYAHLKIYYCTGGCDNFTDFTLLNNTDYTIIVIRKERFVDTLFIILVLCLVVTANLGMGCKVDLEVVKAVLRRPTAPIIGFLCQFTIMPPLSFLLARVFNLSPAEQLGLLAVGSSPGGGASNMWTLLFNGDVSLSITMTLISTISSLGMFPLWIFTLGKIIMDEAEFSIPFQNILGSLVGILVPVGIGIILQRYKPDIAKKIAKITKPMLFVFLIFMFTFGLWVNLYMFRLFHLKLILAACLLPYIGFIAGGLVAWICVQPRARVISICLETGIQNVGVAIFALKLSLPQPDNDLSIAGAVCPSSFTPIPLLIILIGVYIRKCCLKGSEKGKFEGVKADDKAGVDEGVAMTDISGNGQAMNGTSTV